MIIGIDGNEANVSQRVGIGEYAFHILCGLYNRTKVERQKAKIQVRIYLKEPQIEDLPPEDTGWQYTVFGPQRLWTQIALPLRLYLDREKPDVFFSPSHYAPRFSPSVIKIITSIMDLSYLRFPELFTKKDLHQLTRWTKYSAHRAKKIITISEYSKQDIMRFYGFSSEKIEVAYPGYDKNNYTSPIQNSKLADEINHTYGIHQEYILFVGTIQPRKNIVRLVEGFETIKRKSEKYKKLQLVIVGKKGWLWESIIERINKSPFYKDIIVLYFIQDRELAALYHHAKCFILPSLHEGFGIPVIEAMACGCPVVASNVSSLPEIVKDAGILIDPGNTEALADAILEAGYNESRRAILIKKGFENLKRFSMETFVEKIWQVIKEVANYER